MQTCKLKNYPKTLFEVKSINDNTVNLAWYDGVLEGDWMFNYQCNISETNLNTLASTVTYNHKDLNNQYNAKIKQAVPVYDDYDEDEEDEEPTPRVKKSKPKVNKDFRYFVSRLERM